MESYFDQFKSREYVFKKNESNKSVNRIYFSKKSLNL